MSTDKKDEQPAVARPVTIVDDFDETMERLMRAPPARVKAVEGERPKMVPKRRKKKN